MKISIILSIISFLGVSAVYGQSGDTGKTASAKNNQGTEKNAAIDKDVNELKDFKLKADQYEEAWNSKNVSRMRILKAEMISDMNREISQGEQKLQANAQKTTAVKSGKNTADNTLTETNAGTKKSDEFASREDVLKRQHEILAKFKDTEISTDPAFREKMVADKALISDFIKAMENEIIFSRSEAGEAKRDMKQEERQLHERKVIKKDERKSTR